MTNFSFTEDVSPDPVFERGPSRIEFYVGDLGFNGNDPYIEYHEYDKGDAAIEDEGSMLDEAIKQAWDFNIKDVRPGWYVMEGFEADYWRSYEGDEAEYSCESVKRMGLWTQLFRKP